MLWMDYYFYLSKLPEEERRNQILLLIGFFIVLFIIGGLGLYQINLLTCGLLFKKQQILIRIFFNIYN